MIILDTILQIVFPYIFYGPEIFAADTYPRLELFYSMGYRWGALNNTEKN